ncbi:MAG: acyltransferase [Enterobacteriaceae bacterium]
MKIGKELSFGIDVIRVVACFLVVLLHVSGIEFEKYASTWHTGNIIDSFTRVCVPLFIMITGALLIGEKGVSLLSNLKRCRRIFFIILFWSLFYTLYDFSWPYGVYDWIVRFLTKPMKFHLWYLYATIGFYIAIPILSALYLRVSRRELWIYLLLWMVASNMGLFDQTFGTYYKVAVDTYRLGIFSNFLGYLLLGKLVADYFCENSQPLRARYSLLIYAAMSLITALLTWMMTARSGSPNTAFYAYATPFTIVSSCALFLLLLQCSRYLQKFHEPVRGIASHTLGIYCIHVMFIELVVRKSIAWLQMDMGASSMVLFSLVVFALSYAACYLMKKVKYLDRVV